MAPHTKSRNNRRPSSSTSYTSTLTTLVFISLCVLAVWMLTSNSVVSPKTVATINTAATTNEDRPETTTTAAATTTTNNNPEETPETTATINNSDDSSGTTTTTTTTTEDSPETAAKSQDQKDTTTVYGDNSGSDAIKNDDGNTNSNTNNDESSFSQKQKESMPNSDNDQKSTESEKDEQSNQKDEQNTEPHNSNAGENQEQGRGGTQPDVQSFDTDQASKVNDDEVLNEQQLREDKGEITEKDQKQSSNEEQKENLNNVQDESQETEKPKAEKSRRKSSKPEEKESKKSWSTQADESRIERQKEESGGGGGGGGGGDEEGRDLKWNLCNVTAGADFIPCLDNEKYLKTSHRKHYEHRERHCPEDAPTCLVPLPHGYKTRIQWPSSRDKVWYHNVPHKELAEVKGHQNWVKLKGEFLTFPGGGTQFIHGALHYIDFLEKAEPGIAWGKRTRVILDVGCGVGSFGGYLFERDVIAMSFAPKDEHEAQVQFALERGIPAISAVMGTQRLQFPSHVFDLIHCARCRVPWHEDGGLLLLELNRLLRPGGYFVWSATPVYQTLEEDVEIWKHMTSLTKAMCWDLVTIKNDTLNQVGAAFYRKPTTNECYKQREQNQPPMCKDDDDPNAAWYVPLQACLHKLAEDKAERGARWPETWPVRLDKVPYWLDNLHISPKDFEADNERWKNVVDELSSVGVTWSNVRNIMDMRAVYGGFGAALKDLPVWVFNLVNMDGPDTLPIIFERGLIGIYHDWCESFSTYPRTYDLLHADHLFSNLKNRCKLVPVIAEVDRIVRPGGNLIVRDESSAVEEVENLLKSLHWEITKNQEGLLCAKKGTWRPNSSVNLF